VKYTTLIFCAVFLFFGLTTKASAATYYWYGGTGNWSSYASHWSTNSGNSPSSPAPSAPLSTDSVIFDANSGSGTMTIDTASITVASFDASATSIAINDGGHSVTVNGNILIANTASRLTSTGIWTQGASGNISNPQSGNYFKQLIIAGSGVITTMTGNVWIGLIGGGILTMGPGTFNGAGQTLYFYTATNDALTVNNLNMGSNLGAFYFTPSANITQKAFTLPNNFGSVVINLNTIRNLTATGDFNLGNNFLTISNSSVTGTPTNYLDMASSALTSGLIQIGTSNTNSYIKFGSSLLHSVNGIQRQGTGTANIIDMGGSTITSSGNINFTGINVTSGTSTLVMTGTSSLTSAGQTLNNLTHSSSGALTLIDNPTIGGNFIISAGTLSPGATTVIMNGNGKTLTTNSQTLNNFEASGNTILGSNLVLSGNLTIDSGKTFDTSSSNYTVNVAGNWANSGTYTGNNSLVTLNGSGGQTMTGSNTFYQLTASASSPNRTLTFANGTTQTISNALTLNGSGGNILLLRSDSPTHQWNITPNGSRTVDYVDVQDSNNTIVATPIVATNSIDSGNNTHWTITPTPLTVSVQVASSITKTGGTLNGNITNTGGINPSERGFNLYNGSTCSGNIIQNPKDTGGSYGTGAYSKTVTGLSNNTQYSYTAYAINSSGTGTSVCQSFGTAGDVYYIINGNNTYVRGAISSNKDIAQQYVTFGPTNNNNFNFGNTYIINSSTPNTISDYTAGTSLGSGGDDATPVNTVNAGYFMSDHGLNSPVITATTDKTSSDVGSTWQDSGGHQFIIAGVSGTGTETITLYSIPSGSPWSYATAVSGATLTWVSGGTHQGSITITSQTAIQQYPVVKNIVHHILADGTTEITSGASGYANFVDMSEEFDVIDPSTIKTTNNPFVWNDATGIWLHVKNVFHATAGITVIHSTYTVSRPINLGYFGIIQVGPITAPAYDHQYYYIPKTKPVSGYDFTTPQLLDSAPSSSVIFNSSYITDINNPPDRQIILLKKNADSNYDIGFAFGYSPYGSTAASNRTCASYTDGCWWIYTSKKTYPVMDGGTGVVNSGTYDAYAYRQFIDPTSYDIGKSAYWNNLNGHEIVNIDYHRSATNDVTTLPSQFSGWNVKVIDSANIQTPQSNVAGDGTLTLSTTGSNTSGYAELELSPQITSFNFTSPAITGVINNTNNTISLTVPSGTGLTNLTPTITVSSGAIVSPSSGTGENFSSPVVYTVTSADGVTHNVYTVTVTVAAPVDTTPPITTATPAGGTYGASRNITLSCLDDISGCNHTYYTINGDTPTVSSTIYLTTPITISANTTLKFFSVDTVGNPETPKTETYVIDTTYPVTDITSNPSAITNSTSATFVFSANKSGSTFQCKLDSGSYTACTSPQAYTSLAEGSHTFTVQATDTLSHTEPSPPSYTWVVDTLAPSAVDVPSFGTITSASIVVVKPATVTETGSGLYQWQVRKNSTTELGLNNISTTSITDSALSENTQYTYDVQFKDNANNVSSYGTQASKYTLVDTPTNLSASSSSSSVSLTVDSFPNDTSGSSGYYFSNTTNGNNSGWIQTNSWQDTGLSCGTSYTYSVMYRNGDGTETSSISTSQSTGGCSHGGGYLIQPVIAPSLAPALIKEGVGGGNYNFGPTTLRNGSKGEAVKELQRFLNDKLNLGLIVDGKLGPKTIAVIKKWQKANGLVPDGLVGKLTKAKMNGK